MGEDAKSKYCYDPFLHFQSVLIDGQTSFVDPLSGELVPLTRANMRPFLARHGRHGYGSYINFCFLAPRLGLMPKEEFKPSFPGRTDAYEKFWDYLCLQEARARRKQTSSKL